jgi:ribosome-associated protein
MRLHYMLRPEEVDITAIRAQGAGGQNVNKVSNAVHLRFDITASSLPDELKVRLLAVGDQRISKDGVVIIKAQGFRSLEKNRIDALRRLEELIDGAATVQKTRRPTRPGKGAVERRLAGKTHRSAIKAGRKAGFE